MSVIRRVYIDKHRIKQVLIVFISNSIKYTTKGVIKVDVSYDYGIVKIKIVDNGIGIKKEMQSCIFEPFAYVTAQCNQNETRIGIHMYLCNEIVKLLNGKIELSSEESKGTDILIQVPTLDPTSETLQGKLMQTEVFI